MTARITIEPTAEALWPFVPHLVAAVRGCQRSTMEERRDACDLMMAYALGLRGDDLKAKVGAAALRLLREQGPQLWPRSVALIWCGVGGGSVIDWPAIEGDADPVYACDEHDCDEHVYSWELCWLKDDREVCQGCFESGYDRDGYPIAERVEGGAP